MTPLRKIEKGALAGLLLAAFGIRVLLVLSLEDKPYFYNPVIDSAAYDAWGKEIAGGELIGTEAFYQDPLYPYFLGGIYSLAGHDLMRVRMVQAFLGVVGCWFLFAAARRMGGTAVAFVALILAAFYKPLLFYDTALLKEWLAVFLVEALLFFLALENRKGWIGAGISLGLAILVRANLLLFAIVLVTGLLIRKRFAPALLVAGGLLLMIAPVTIRNGIVAGDFVLTTYQLGPNLYIGNHSGNETGRYVPPPFLTTAAPGFEEKEFRAEAERSRGRSLLPSEISSHYVSRTRAEFDSGRFLKVTGRRIAEYGNNYEVPDNYNYSFMKRFSWVLRAPLPGFWILAFLAPMGMIFAWRDRKKWAWVYLLVTAYFLSIIFFFVFARYRIPVVPPLILFAAMGMVELWKRCRKKHLPWVPLVVGTLCLAQSLIPIGRRDFRVAHYNLALHYFENDQPAKSAAELELVREVKQPQWIYLRGLAYEKAEIPDQALEAFYEAANLDPASADAALHLGMAYRESGDPKEALRWFREARRRDPNHLEATLQIGRSYMLRGEWTRAEEIFSLVTDQSWKGHLELARLYKKIGIHPRVIEEADKVLEAVPGHPEARQLRNEAMKR